LHELIGSHDASLGFWVIVLVLAMWGFAATVTFELHGWEFTEQAPAVGVFAIHRITAKQARNFAFKQRSELFFVLKSNVCLNFFP
jgi:hypothetical protein